MCVGVWVCVCVCVANRCNQYDMTPMQYNANQFSSNRPQTCTPSPREGASLGICTYTYCSLCLSGCSSGRLWCSHFVVRGAAVVHWRPGDGCTNNGQVIIAWRCKGSHKVSPLMMGVVVWVRVRVLVRMVWRVRCHSRGCHCRRCMLVLLMAAVRLEFRAWYAQLFDLGQIGLHAEVGWLSALLPVDLLSCFNDLD